MGSTRDPGDGPWAPGSRQERDRDGQRGEPEAAPGVDGVARQEGDPVAGRTWLPFPRRRHPGTARGARQRRHEMVVARSHRLGGDRGEIRPAGAGLVAVDLLQGEDVGVQGPHRGRQASHGDAPVQR